jgi:long-chain acyl-CoA synthetase
VAEEPPLTLPQAIDRTAARLPDKVAYIQGGGAGRNEITWLQLGERSRATAAGFITLGLYPGDRVAICAENSIDWIVAANAIARAGGISVLVYFELKPEEIVRQVSWARCRYLIASAEVLAKLGDAKTGAEAVISLDEPVPGTIPFGRLGEMAAEAPGDVTDATAPQPDDVAVIVYTSGTTSGAKGVMLTHRNLLSNASAAAETFDLGPDDSTLLVLPLHHALPFLAAAVLVPLIGGTVVIENDLRRIRDRLQEHSPTVFFGVPALYELMYRNVIARAEAEGRLSKLRRAQRALRLMKRLTGVNLAPVVFRQVHQALGGKLRFMVSGGAALNPQTMLDFSCLGLPLLQGWGMSEASPAIAAQRFSPWRFRFTNYYEKHAGSVGPPLPGIEVKLIDVPGKDIRVSERGEGEVCVRGPSVFAGYWGAEEETRAAIVDGWLHTGDVGRIDKQGNIYLTGRSKYIIVLGSGEKVFPDEVEATLQQSPLLADVVVVEREARGKPQVAALVYPDVEVARERSAPLDEEELRRMVADDVDRRCREMAAYKRVTVIELTDSPLPKTPLRKVARGALAPSYEFSFERWLASGNEQ